MNKIKVMYSTLLLLAALLCTVPRCLADGADITVNGGWGLKPVSYQAALKKARFPILLLQSWKGKDCVFYLNWIKTVKTEAGSDPGPSLPSRQAIAVMLKGNSKRLILEAPYLKNYSVNANWYGMDWITAAGYFTKPLGSQYGEISIGHRGGTSYAIVSSSGDTASNKRFEKSLR